MADQFDMGYGGQGMMGMMYPQLMGPMRQQMYGQALLNQAADVSPVRSPYQALARALSGALGGYEMGQGQQAAIAANQAMYADAAARQATLLQSFYGGQGPAPSASPATPGTLPSAQPAAALDPGKDLAPIYDQAATSSGIPKNVLLAKDSFESGFKNVGDPAAPGAVGIPQILASTADKPGYGVPPLGAANRTNPSLAIPFGGSYLAGRMHDLFGDQTNLTDPVQLREGLKAYHGAGPGNVDANGVSDDAYADKIMANAGYGADNQGRYVVASNVSTPGGPAAPPQPDFMSMYLRAAAMSTDPNPVVRAMAPQAMDIAKTMLSRRTTPVEYPPGSGQFVQVDPLTNQITAAGRPASEDTQRRNLFNNLMTKWQQDPKSLNASELQQLETEISQRWPVKTEYVNGIPTHYQPITPPAGVPSPADIQSVRGGQAPTAAPAAAPAATPASGLASLPPAAQEATIKRVSDAIADYREKSIKPAMDEATAGADIFSNAQAIRSQLQQGAITGVWAPERTDLARYMSALNFSPDTIKAVLGSNSNVAASQLMNKELLGIVQKAVRSMGAREPGSVLTMFQRAFPNMEMDPNATDAMLRMLETTQMRNQDHANAMQSFLGARQAELTNLDAYASFESKLGQFERLWQQTHNPRVYEGAAFAAARDWHDGKGVNPSTSYAGWSGGLSDPQQAQALNILSHLYDPGGSGYTVAFPNKTMSLTPGHITELTKRNQFPVNSDFGLDY